MASRVSEIRTHIAAIGTSAATGQSNRFVSLDGLRGLAALSVFFSHAVGMVPETPIITALRRSPINVVWDGAAAVYLFFVLSGFVLALPFVGSLPRPLKLADFITRRLFRIYPAYLTAIAIGFLLYLHGPVRDPGVSQWFTKFWTTPVYASDLVKHFVLIGPRFDMNAINPVIWSLMVETRISLLMPVIIFFLRRSTIRLDVAALLISALLPSVFDIPFFAHFLPCFLIGAQVAKYRHQLQPICHRLSPAWRNVLGVGSILLYGSRMFTGEPNLLLTTGGSVGLIICVMHFPAFRSTASHPLSLLLGNLSYAFYLLHLPILIFVAALTLPAVHSLPIVCAVSLCGSLLLSAAIHRCVELPFQRFGKAAWPYVGMKVSQIKADS